MTKNTFAKLFELGEDDYQVLVTIGYDPENEYFQLKQETEIDGIHTAVTGSFKKEKDCMLAFREYKPQTAVAFLNAAIAIVRGGDKNLNKEDKSEEADQPGPSRGWTGE